MMTSESECYVYIQLPGSMEVVTCARYVRERLRGGEAVGRLVYGRSYRERPDAVPLDPYNLPVTTRRYETAKLNGIFGALRDASPDAWGRRVIERFVGRGELDEVEYLLYSPEDRAGALSFGRSAVPPQPRHEFNRIVHLRELRNAARLLEEDDVDRELPAHLHELVDPGTSMGGARPKNVVEDDDGLWIAKFPARSDRWNNAPVEAAMLSLAALCGIRVPETRIERVGAEMVLLLKRFDRENAGDGFLRHRMLSSLTVLGADESATARTNWSYVLFADELQRWSSHPGADRKELFRRMVFNALISNLDDHPRNHAVLAPGAEWRLAPAYDLTPNPVHSLDHRELALVCGLEGRSARRGNLVSQAPRFGLSREDASGLISEMKRVVGARWKGEVLRHGGTETDCRRVASAFVYEGFEYPPGSAPA